MVDHSKRLERKPSSVRMGSSSPKHEHSRNIRVMNHLKDALISQLTKLEPSLSLNPRHIPLIKRRLRHLFPSLHTPTHPPYAWMIRSAIIELKEKATETTISNFIKREYNDLPWAHLKILSMQLDKLCEIEEIALVQDGRYMLKIYDEKDIEQCQSSSAKRKKGKRKSEHSAVENVEEKSQEPRIQVFEKQSQNMETEALGKAAESQDDNQASPKGDLEEHPMSRDFDQKPSKRPRGKLHKLETGVNYLEESLLPLDDDININNEQTPNIKKMEKRLQYGSCRGRGRPARVRGERVGRGNGGGMKLGVGRGQGKPLKLDQIDQQCKKYLPQDQDNQRGRGPSRGRGRPRKLTQRTNECKTQLSQKVQAKLQHVRGRGRGRPPKKNQNVDQGEDQSQDQAPSSGKGDNQSLERNQLQVQNRGRYHKSEFEEAKPPAVLRLRSESRSGSGDVSQSNVDANHNWWRLQPVPSRTGWRSLKQN